MQGFVETGAEVEESVGYDYKVARKSISEHILTYRVARSCTSRVHVACTWTDAVTALYRILRLSTSAEKGNSSTSRRR